MFCYLLKIDSEGNIGVYFPISRLKNSFANNSQRTDLGWFVTYTNYEQRFLKKKFLQRN